MDQKAYWVGFNLIKGIGAVRLQRLLDHFGDLATAWKASPAEIRASGLPEKIVQSFLAVRHQTDLERVWESIESKKIRVITWEDNEFPRLLKESQQPPPVLYVLGEILPADEVAVAIVGTRRMTSYGRQVTEEVTSYLSSRGVTIVSGLARGVDALAHQAALRAGGRTLAVLGSGVDVIYPPEHQKMAGDIAAHGAIISDYPPGTQPEASNFPPRNRIVSGLSRAVIVVEAGNTSGALITAAFAADQGRDVLAVPGSIYAPQSKGVNRLIAQGARPLLSPADVLETLDILQAQTQQAARRVIPAGDLEDSIYQLLGSESKHVDELSQQSGLPIEKVSATLTLMELKGMVRHLGGMNYVTIHDEQSPYNTD